MTTLARAATLPRRLASSPFRRSLVVGLGAFALSRLLVVAGVYVRAAQVVTDQQARFQPLPDNMRRAMQNILLQWDGKWYRMIAHDWYPRELAERITYVRGNSATVAFFPVYPMLSRAFDLVFPGGVDEAMIAVNVVLSAIAVVLVGMLARDLYGHAAATRAMVLFSFFPGSVALSWSYAEASMIVAAAACFLLLRRERWLLAGLAAAIGTATRPNAIGLVAACAVAALIAIVARRQWRALIAVALAPVGVVGYHAYLWWWTGEQGAWMRAQREAWDEGWSWGATAWRFVWRFLENPLGTDYGPTYLHTTLALVVAAFGIFCAIRERLPWPMLAYVAVVVGLMVAPETVSARPRFVLAAFPLVLATAAWLGRRHHRIYEAAVVASAGGLVAFTTLYASYAAIP